MKAFFIAVFLGGFICSGLAQLPATNTASQMRVFLWVPHARVPYQAPTNIDMQAFVRFSEPGLQKGDVVNVRFFADDKFLGSGKAVWHGMIRPHGPPGTAVPMFVVAAGFNPTHWIWTNAPAGTYTLTAQAAWTNGLSAVSAPVTVTVLPPKSP